MSIPGQATPPTRPRGAVRAVLVQALRVLVAIPVLAVLLLLLLWLRLCWGPIEIGWLAHRLAPTELAGERLGFNRAWLARSGNGDLSLAASDLSLRLPGIEPDMSAARLVVSLQPSGLFMGEARIGTVSLRDAVLHLARSPDGAVELLHATPTAGGGTGSGAVRFARLRGVSIRALAVTLQDRSSGHAFGAEVAEADLTPWGGTLASGRLRARLSADGRDVAVRGDGVADKGGLRWHAESGAVRPADFAQFLPALTAIGVPVTPTLDLQFAPNDPRPRTAHVVVGLGAGTLAVADGSLPVQAGRVELNLTRTGAAGLTAVLRSWRLALAPLGSGGGGAAAGSATTPPGPDQSNGVRTGTAAAGSSGPSTVASGTEARTADAPPAGAEAAQADVAPVFQGNGTATVDDLRHPERIRAALTVNSASVRFAGLERYWPAGVAKGARRWITDNITAGVASNLHVETVLSGDRGWSSLREIRRGGGFDARELEMWWLRPMPPLQHMAARATFQGTDALLVESPSAILPVDAVGAEAERMRGDAVLQPLAVSDGSMRITGLDGKDQIGAVHLVVAGALRGLLCELANPRLSLLSRHPVPFTAPGGTVRSEVSVQLPLDNKVAIEDVSVLSRSQLRGAHLGNVAGGLSLDDADLDVVADTSGLTLDGQGAIGPVDSRLQYRMDFTAGGPDQLVEQARVEGTVGADALATLGVAVGDAVGGDGGVTLTYQDRRDGLSRIGVALDMTGMGIALPVWSKRAGQKASLDAQITLDHGHLRSVGPIRADGPDLSIEGTVSTPPDGPRLLRVPRFLLGRTRGAGEVWFPRAGAKADASAPIRVSAHGATLDLASIIDATPVKPTAPARKPADGKAARKPAPSAKGPAWVADLRFGRVFVGQKTALGTVSAHLENDGDALVRARVDAADPTALVVRLDKRDGERVLDGTAADTGLLLRALGVTDQMAGGAMHLTATLPYPVDPSRAAKGIVAGPMTGTVEIGRFVVPDAPFAARLVRDLSIYGWLLAPRTPELTVDRLVAPFSLTGDVLTLSDARAHAAALGLTMRGRVDLGRQRLDLHGTVVPAWALNQLPGRLPLVGRLLAPEKGGGVVAVTLGIAGAFADPKISVDPLSALAPGFLRKLFFR